MSTIRKLAGQSAIYGLSSILGRFLNYLLVPLHTNIFVNPGDYGIVTEMYAYISFLIIIFTFGLETSFFHFSERKKEEPRKVFGTSMGYLATLSVILTGGIILFRNDLASITGYVSNPEYITWVALIIGFDALTALPFARLRQQQKAIRFALLKLAGIGVNIGFNLLFFLVLPKIENHTALTSWYDPSVGVGYVFIANLLASAVTLLLLLPSMRFSASDVDKTLLKEILLYASPLLVAGLAGMVNETLDRVMIKYLVADRTDAMAQVGIYGACYKLSILMTLFVQAYRYAAEPFFFSKFKSDDAKTTYARLMKLFVMVCGFIFLFIMMYIDLFKYFIGRTYWPGLSIVPVLLLANICLGIFYNLSMWYKLTGKTRFGAVFALLGAMVTIIFNLLLIPTMGYTGAAWTTLICYAFMMLLSWVTGQRHYPIPYETGRIVFFLLLALILFAITELIRHYLSPALLLQMVINTIALGVYGYVLFKAEGRVIGQ